MKILALLFLIIVNTALADNEAALEEFVDANNLVAASFYKQIGQYEKGSFLVSPYSAEAVLAFVQSGCKGETGQEIRNALHLPDDKDKVESLVNQSISTLKGNDLYTLNTATKMYVLEIFSIEDEFKETATDVYHSEIENINFIPQDTAAKKMNDWVEKQTNKKIKNLINPLVLTSDSVAVLINAVYFKGNWSYSFDEQATKKKNFYKTKQDIVQVDTMYLYEEWFSYYEDPEIGAKFLELPFEGGEASMVIALPNQKDGLTPLENQIEQVFAPQKFKIGFFNVQMPKFKIESTLPLVETLKNLGIKKPFDRSQADLSGIAGRKGQLVISDVLQKTYINVEEGGVEAAAATYDGITLVSVPPPAEEFIVDHPFIFYIKAKNFVIFAGRYAGPL